MPALRFLLPIVLLACMMSAVSAESTPDDTPDRGTFDLLFFDSFIVAPPTLNGYPDSPYSFLVGGAVQPLVPSVIGQTTLWTINPALPTGLNLDSATGVVDGAPTQASVSTEYQVTASNSFGADSASVFIEVVDALCDGELVGGFCWWFGANGQSCDTVCADHGGYNAIGTRDYAGSGGSNAQCGAVMTALVTQGAINPTPVTAAANIDGVTGLGCASDFESSATTFRVTSTTTSSATETFTRRACACNDQPPPISMNYPAGPFVFGKDVAIAPIVPTVSGYVDEFVISPSLPAGLTIDAASGEISGAPTTTSAQTLYTITGVNAGGSVQDNFMLEVIVQAPSNLQYPLSSYVFDQNQAISPQTPTYDGSNATSFSISQSLPAGLSFNTSNGTISGAPSVVTAPTNRTVTVTNQAGSAQVVINIEVVGPFSCDGDAVGGFCWYFGSNNQSCDTVCSTHGGYNAGTASYAGSGGTANQCRAVLQAVGAIGSSATPIEQTSLSGITGLGCGSDYTDNATSYRITSATTSGASSASSGGLFFRRACACNQ